MVSPVQKKQAVDYVIDQRLCSVRRACCYLVVHRSTYRYQAQELKPKQLQLHQRIVGLSWEHPRYGYRRIRALLVGEGWSVSRKQVQRVRRKEGLKVASKPKRESPREILRGCLRKQLILILSGLGILFLTERTRAARSKY